MYGKTESIRRPAVFHGDFWICGLGNLERLMRIIKLKGYHGSPVYVTKGSIVSMTKIDDGKPYTEIHTADGHVLRVLETPEVILEDLGYAKNV